MQEGDTIIFRPTGPDRNMLMRDMVLYTKGEITNNKLKEKLDRWCTRRECDILERWLPDEKDLKNEEDDRAFTESLEEEVDEIDQF